MKYVEATSRPSGVAFAHRVSDWRTSADAVWLWREGRYVATLAYGGGRAIPPIIEELALIFVTNKLPQAVGTYAFIWWGKGTRELNASSEVMQHTAQCLPGAEAYFDYSGGVSSESRIKVCTEVFLPAAELAWLKVCESDLDKTKPNRAHSRLRPPPREPLDRYNR